MRKLLSILALLAFAVATHAQSMGQTEIVQGGHIAVVTSGGAVQVDLYSTGGTTFSGATSGSLPVTIVSGAGSGGTAAVDEAAFTLGTTSYTPIGCYYQTTVTTGALTSGQGGVAQCDTNRRLFVVGAGTAGSASGGVVTVQGVASMTPFLVNVRGNIGAAFDSVIGAAPPANAVAMAGLGSGATGGLMMQIPVADTSKSVNITSATTTLLITGVSGRYVHVGSYEMYVGAADNIEFIEGTGGTCGTNTTGMIGGATSGTSMVFGASGGVVHGSGLGNALLTYTAGESICMVTSTSANVGIHLVYSIY